jgi:hypothetical protein
MVVAISQRPAFRVAISGVLVWALEITAPANNQQPSMMWNRIIRMISPLSMGFQSRTSAIAAEGALVFLIAN